MQQVEADRDELRVVHDWAAPGGAGRTDRPGAWACQAMFILSTSRAWMSMPLSSWMKPTWPGNFWYLRADSSSCSFSLAMSLSAEARAPAAPRSAGSCRIVFD